MQFPVSTSAGLTAIDHVAIIGAGPAGSATAYFLHQLCPNISTIVHEATGHIGGRSTTIDVLGESIELGASIFVDVNRNLKSAAAAFNLTVSSPDEYLNSDEQSLGIWNGQDFVYVDHGDSSWWNVAKLVWKYGLSPYRAKRHVDGIIDQFLGIYNGPAEAGLTETASRLDLLQYTNTTGSVSYAKSGVSQKFYEEIVNAATRVNYAQEVSSLHGLMSAVSFVTDDARSIKGGNWQIFRGMIDKSEATIHLESRIATISRLSMPDSHPAWQVCTTHGDCTIHRHVVLSAPASLSGIQFSPPLKLEPVEYVTLHVTVLATRRRLSTRYFGLSDGGARVPSSILTTTAPGVDRPPFQSVSIVGKSRAGELIYKVFSLEPPSDALLADLFADDEGVRLERADAPDDLAAALHRHVWRAYPVGLPTARFDDWELAPGLWYTGSMERLISTMETATVAGRSVARLLAGRVCASS